LSYILQSLGKAVVLEGSDVLYTGKEVKTWNDGKWRKTRKSLDLCGHSQKWDQRRRSFGMVTENIRVLPCYSSAVILGGCKNICGPCSHPNPNQWKCPAETIGFFGCRRRMLLLINKGLQLYFSHSV
jgi:hypothetical protein